MQVILNYKYKLYTEEELKDISDYNPELKKCTFSGFCIQTKKKLLYGPEAKKGDYCLNCYPNSHFYLVPLNLLNLDETTEEKQSEKNNKLNCTRPKYITLVKS